MKKLIAILIVMCLCNTVRATSLESILFGSPPPTAELGVASLKLPDPVSIVVGFGMGPDIDNPDNEYNVLVGMRYNQFEIGPKLYLWPGSEDNHSAWGIYCLRHLSYDDLLIGTPFVGFEATLAGKTGDMYAILAGFDKDIKGVILRTSVSRRDFDSAMAETHKDESDEFAGKVELVIRF